MSREPVELDVYFTPVYPVQELQPEEVRVEWLDEELRLTGVVKPGYPSYLNYRAGEHPPNPKEGQRWLAPGGLFEWRDGAIVLVESRPADDSQLRALLPAYLWPDRVDGDTWSTPHGTYVKQGNTIVEVGEGYTPVSTAADSFDDLIAGADSYEEKLAPVDDSDCQP